jgi:hypothetical protein
MPPADEFGRTVTDVTLSIQRSDERGHCRTDRLGHASGPLSKLNGERGCRGRVQFEQRPVEH